jgi:aryl-alcohol dehydrogenase-like predicted oxidoreductase
VPRPGRRPHPVLPARERPRGPALGPADRTVVVDNVAKAFDRDVDKPVVDAIQRVAEARGVPMAQVALAWVLSKPVVSCPIVGATKPNHLQDAVAALDLALTEPEIAALEERYTPQDNYWW